MAQESDVTKGKEPVHVLDLPQLYQKPSAASLGQALDLLASKHTGFAHESRDDLRAQSQGITRYLTDIISSPLAWLPADEVREGLRERASTCLVQRSGRTAMGDVTRSFEIELSFARTLRLSLREPGLTGDDLGHKTWSSSLVLARNLHTGLQHTVPSAVFYSESRWPPVLELGAGTGLLGLAAAASWRTRVTLTDLPEIHPNLSHNVQTNSETIRSHSGKLTTGTLDWRQPDHLTMVDWSGELRPVDEKFSSILAADPIYSPEHPRLLVDAVLFWLTKKESTLILAYPLREAYRPQIEELESLLDANGLRCAKSLEVQERDDWKDMVNHKLSLWFWKPKSQR